MRMPWPPVGDISSAGPTAAYSYHIGGERQRSISRERREMISLRASAGKTRGMGLPSRAHMLGPAVGVCRKGSLKKKSLSCSPPCPICIRARQSPLPSRRGLHVCGARRRPPSARPVRQGRVMPIRSSSRRLTQWSQCGDLCRGWCSVAGQNEIRCVNSPLVTLCRKRTVRNGSFYEKGRSSASLR